MAENMITHRGTTTGYQAVGDEVRSDAGSPRPASFSLGSQFRQSFTPPEPLGQPPRAPAGPQEKCQERPEPPEDDDGQGGADSREYSARLEMPGAAYGGAAWTRGGPLADAITNGDRPAIEGPKVIGGATEAL